MYMSSQSSGTGQATVTLSFTAGTDPDEAVQQVQNQLQSAMRKLPQAVQNQGVTVRKTGDTNILTIAFVSTDGSMDKQDIADYVASNIQDPLSRVNGVGDIDAYGSQYSMRIWLDPAKLNSFQMTAKDVTDAISSQNAQIAVGQLGGTPSVDKQALNATINSQSLLQTPGTVPVILPCGLIRTVRKSPLATSPPSRWGRKNTITSAATTARRRPGWGLSWPLAQTKWRPLNASSAV